MTRCIECGDPALRQKEAHRAVHLVEPFADPSTHALVLLRRGPHQGDLGIVNVKLALAIALGNGVGRAEIDHVERADRADEGHAAADGCAKAVVGGGKHAAHQEIADFRRREVDDRGEHSGIDQLFHRAAADAGGVEDQTFEIVAQVGRDFLNGRRGHAEHGDADGWQSRRRVAFGFGLIVQARLHHAGERIGTIGEHGARDRIEALHVGDGIHHGDIGRSDIGTDISRRDRGDDEFRHADGEGAHGGRDQRGAAGATRRNDAGDVALTAQPVGEGVRHRRHRRAAVGPEHSRPAAPVVERDFLGGDVAGGELSAGGHVDQPCPQALSGDQVADEAQFLAFGIERAGDEDDGRARHVLQSGAALANIPRCAPPGSVC